MAHCSGYEHSRWSSLDVLAVEVLQFGWKAQPVGRLVEAKPREYQRCDAVVACHVGETVTNDPKGQRVYVWEKRWL